MSASNRKLSRLPLEIFRNLDSNSTNPEELRSAICSRLRRFPFRPSSRKKGITSSASVKTMGDLLRTSKRTLLYALDPLLTYGKSNWRFFIIKLAQVPNEQDLNCVLHTYWLINSYHEKWKLKSFWIEHIGNVLRNHVAPSLCYILQPTTWTAQNNNHKTKTIFRGTCRLACPFWTKRWVVEYVLVQ